MRNKQPQEIDNSDKEYIYIYINYGHNNKILLILLYY